MKKRNDNFKLGFDRFKEGILKRKKESFWILILMIPLYTAPSIIPMIIGKLINSIINPTTTFIFNNQIETSYLLIIVFSIVKFIERFSDILMYNYYISKISNSMYIDYTKKIFSKLISFPVSFFKKESLGKITYSVNTGANTLSSSIHSFPDMFGFPVMILLASVFLFFVSWQAGVLILLMNFILIIYFYYTIKERKKVTREFNDEKKKISNFITQNINLAIEVKRNSNEEKEKEILNTKFKTEYKEKFKNLFVFGIKKNIFTNIIPFIFFTLLWLLIVYLYKEKMINAGDIVSINMYAMNVTRNIHWIVKGMNEYIEGFTIIGDTERLINNTFPENYSKNKVTKEILGDVIFDNVSFEYEKDEEIKKTKDNILELKDKKKFSLKNINIKINKGQKVAFVGESGGGKTTLIELVGGFYFPTSGEVKIDGISTKKWNLTKLRNSMAYVSQDIAIFNSTIKENISYGALKEVTLEEIKKAAKLANIDNFIENLPDGYDTKVGEKGLKLSGGQKQRISIARAILRNPKILILDEPTSALDIISEKYITESLKELMKGRTTIIIAHRISTVSDADNIFVFKKGQLLEQGNYKELILKNGEFKKMVDLHEELQ